MLDRIPIDLQERILCFLPLLGIAMRPVSTNYQRLWIDALSVHPVLLSDWKTLMSLRIITKTLQSHLQEKIQQRIELSSSIPLKSHYLSTFHIQHWEWKRKKMGTSIRILHERLHRMHLKKLKYLSLMRRAYRRFPS